jgi:uncharacterized membrane protein/mono/diheme cytochrome c family protein
MCRSRKEFMPIPASWVEWHAALTHFPIALLLAALFFDAGGIALRRPAWREIGLAVLALSVASFPTALLSGYLAGVEMRRPPVGFDPHWKVAVLTSVLAALLLIWRLRTRSQVERVPQLAMLSLALLSAIAVGYTGHMGGTMVFGGRTTGDEMLASAQDPPTTTSEVNPPAAEKIAIAAGKMEVAAGKLDVATDRLALASADRPAAAPAPSAAPIVVKPVVRPQIQAVPPTAIDNAAQKLERVAERFEATATKMEAISRQLQARGQSTLLTAPSTASGGKVAAGGKPTTATKSTSGGKAAASATQPARSASFDPQLIAAGEKLFFDEDTGCSNCHKMNGKGGRSGPDLTFAGRLHPDLDWQIAHLKNPKSKVPGSSMPPYDDLPPDALRALATLMVSRK